MAHRPSARKQPPGVPTTNPSPPSTRPEGRGEKGAVSLHPTVDEGLHLQGLDTDRFLDPPTGACAPGGSIPAEAAARQRSEPPQALGNNLENENLSLS
jgi:hypothetical protein